MKRFYLLLLLTPHFIINQQSPPFELRDVSSEEPVNNELEEEDFLETPEELEQAVQEFFDSFSLRGSYEIPAQDSGQPSSRATH